MKQNNLIWSIGIGIAAFLLNVEQAYSATTKELCNQTSDNLRHFDPSSDHPSPLWKLGKYTVTFAFTEGVSIAIVALSKNRIKHNAAKVGVQFASGFVTEYIIDSLNDSRFREKINNAETACLQKANNGDNFDPVNFIFKNVGVQPNVRASVIQTNNSTRTITKRRPESDERRSTESDHYCKGDGQNFCSFLIYAGKKDFREQYAMEIGNHDIQMAHIRINAATDNIPPNPYVLNYELIVSINGHKLPEQFKLNKIEHGKPIKGPFDNFTDETIVLPESSYPYFVNGDNEISYRLAGPVGAWIVFKWSELSVKLK